MPWVAGVDGCRGGWIAVLVDHQADKVRSHHIKLYPTFEKILTLDLQPAVIAIDIPIGLLDTAQSGGRVCDRQARQLLSRRASSIFSPPTRPMLKATRYEQVRTKGLSIQSFNILPKIREVDQLITPNLQRRVYEAHPELAFAVLAGTPMKDNKKTRKGQEERLQILKSIFQGIEQTLESSRLALKRSQVARDDIFDAYVLGWTALCISMNKAHHVPDYQQIDRKGLRMEIWFPQTPRGL